MTNESKNKTKNKIYMKNLNFELTRRCNLRCRWCARGNPQSIDITKKIINKTLDEVQDIYFRKISFYGGEPMLNPSMILYLAKQIVERNIRVKFIDIQTNATILNEKIKEALLILSDYFSQVRNMAWMRDIDNFFSSRLKFQDVYKKAENGNILIVLSTYEHDNLNIIDEVYKYYDVGKENVIVLKQRKNGTGHIPITIEGRAKEMWQTFSKDELRLVQIIDNKYCIIQDDFKNDMVYVHKSLTVSANGNVFAGALSSYNNVDAQPMFNIMNCNNDFYKKIDEWCWEHPINQLSNEYRKLNLAIEWQRKHGIKPLYDDRTLDDRTLEYIKFMSDYVNLHERELIKYHKLMPDLCHVDLDTYVTFNWLKNRLTYGLTENQKSFLRICGGFDKDYIESLNLNNEKVAAICEEYEKRAKQKFKGA